MFPKSRPNPSEMKPDFAVFTKHLQFCPFLRKLGRRETARRDGAACKASAQSDNISSPKHQNYNKQINPNKTKSKQQ